MQTVDIASQQRNHLLRATCPPEPCPMPLDVAHSVRPGRGPSPAKRCDYLPQAARPLGPATSLHRAASNSRASVGWAMFRMVVSTVTRLMHPTAASIVSDWTFAVISPAGHGGRVNRLTVLSQSPQRARRPRLEAQMHKSDQTWWCRRATVGKNPSHSRSKISQSMITMPHVDHLDAGGLSGAGFPGFSRLEIAVLHQQYQTLHL